VRPYLEKNPLYTHTKELLAWLKLYALSSTPVLQKKKKKKKAEINQTGKTKLFSMFMTLFRRC
jgi:hypothetical protein